MAKKPHVLVIADGVGVDVPSSSNAVALAKKYNLDYFVSHYYATTLYASSEYVGLPLGSFGNSEVGHLNISAGKIVYQDVLNINRAIRDKSFFINSKIQDAILNVKKKKSKLHLVGTLSYSPRNSLIEHLYTLIEFIKQEGIKDFYLHIILDGKYFDKDTGINILKEVQDRLNISEFGKIVTLCGGNYGMDRDYNWDNTERMYRAMVSGESDYYTDNIVEFVNSCYQEKIYDDEIPPVVVTKNDKVIATIDDNDSVIFFNFKPDTIRQLAKSLIKKDFNEFERKETLYNVYFVTMTEYESGLTDNVAFTNEVVNESLVSIISKNGLKQLHISETEKYPYVTYFLNGQKDIIYPGEERMLIPSKNIRSLFSLNPRMNLFKVITEIVDGIEEDRYDFIVCNLCNCDIMAHSGSIKKTIKAVEYIDTEIREIVDTALNRNGVVFITSDHGNAEKMLDDDKPNKDHTNNPVPFIIVGREFENKKTIPNFNMLSSVEPTGVLADIAPTILKIMGLEKGEEMRDGLAL